MVLVSLNVPLDMLLTLSIMNAHYAQRFKDTFSIIKYLPVINASMDAKLAIIQVIFALHATKQEY